MSAPTQTAYGFGTTLATSYETAIERTKAALATEGFGVLSEIDVHGVLSAKLGIDIGKYVILGACNPNLASRAIAAEREIGLLLPCNVIVHETAGKTHVSIMDPDAALGIVDNDAIAPVAAEAKERLLRVVEALRQGEEGQA